MHRCIHRRIRNSRYLGQSKPIDCTRMAHYGHVSQSYCSMKLHKDGEIAQHQSVTMHLSCIGNRFNAGCNIRENAVDSPRFVRVFSIARGYEKKRATEREKKKQENAKHSSLDITTNFLFYFHTCVSTLPSLVLQLILRLQFTFYRYFPPFVTFRCIFPTFFTRDFPRNFYKRVSFRYTLCYGA